MYGVDYYVQCLKEYMGLGDALTVVFNLSITVEVMKAYGFRVLTRVCYGIASQIPSLTGKLGANIYLTTLTLLVTCPSFELATNR